VYLMPQRCHRGFQHGRTARAEHGRLAPSDLWAACVRGLSERTANIRIAASACSGLVLACTRAIACGTRRSNAADDARRGSHNPRVEGTPAVSTAQITVPSILLLTTQLAPGMRPFGARAAGAATASTTPISVNRTKRINKHRRKMRRILKSSSRRIVGNR
jgi:hypothetical protein